MNCSRTLLSDSVAYRTGYVNCIVGSSTGNFYLYKNISIFKKITFK